jgi:DNA-binding NarL/FixJ family response regulator
MDAVEALAAHRPYFSGALSNEVLDGYLRNATARTAAPDELLSLREQEIAQRIAEGLSTKQIALNLAISAKTVETHRTALMRKIGAHSVADVVRYAIKTESDRFDPA